MREKNSGSVDKKKFKMFFFVGCFFLHQLTPDLFTFSNSLCLLFFSTSVVSGCILSHCSGLAPSRKIYK